MRIGVNTVFLLPGRVGGSETYVIDTLRQAIPLRHDVTWILFTNRENDGLLRRCFGSEPTVACHPLGLSAASKVVRLVGEQVTLPAACRRMAVDLLWSPGYTGPVALKTPQVVSVLDMQYREFPEDFSFPARLALHAIVPRVARRSRAVLTLSAFARAQIERYARVPADRIRVTHLGVDRVFHERLDRPERETRLARWVPPGPYVLCVANTHPHKNVAALVRAFRRLPPAAGLRLVLAGTEGRGEPEVCRAIREAALGDRLTRVSGLPRADLVALYQGAAVFAFPSLYEGFGLPVLEAMASRVPVVAVRRGPVPEVGADTIGYTDGTPEGLAVGLAEALALSPDERVKRVEQAVRRSMEFTWDRTARATLDCLTGAAAAR